MIRHTSLVATTCALVLLAAPAFAQRAVEEEELGEARETLQQRGREVLYPGEPLTLIGLGDGAPGFLAATPALGALTLGSVEVARDELRARKLGLYEGGKAFATGPRREDPRGARDTRHGPTNNTTPPVPEPRAALWPWLIAGAITAASLALKIQTKRRARA